MYLQKWQLNWFIMKVFLRAVQKTYAGIKKRNLHIYQFSCPIKCAFLDLLKTITAQVSERQQINSFATRIFLGKFV